MEKTERDGILEKYQNTFDSKEREIIEASIKRDLLDNMFVEIPCSNCAQCLHAVKYHEKTLFSEYHVLSCPVCKDETVVQIDPGHKVRRVVSREKLLRIAKSLKGKELFCRNHGNRVKVLSVEFLSDDPFSVSCIHTPCMPEQKKGLLFKNEKASCTELIIDLLDHEHSFVD